MEGVKQEKVEFLVWVMLVFSFFMPAVLLNTVGAPLIPIIVLLIVLIPYYFVIRKTAK